MKSIQSKPARKTPATETLAGQERSTVASLLPVVAGASILALAAVFFVWQRHQHVQLGFEVAKLRREKARLEELIEPLVVEVEYLSRLERIDAIARKKLGLRAPEPGQITILEK